MCLDNGIVLNMSVKTFDRAHTKFVLFWFYLTALLMTKHQVNILMPEFKNVLPNLKIQKARPRSRKKCQKEHNDYGKPRNA